MKKWPGTDPEPPDYFNDNLTHLWKMEESSGTRYDAVGNLDMIAANSPSRYPFISSYGLRCAAGNTSYLYKRDRINPGNNNFHILLWIRWNDTSDLGDLDIMTEYYDEYTGYAFRFWYNTSAGLYRWSCGGGTPGIYQGRVVNTRIMVDMYFNTVTNRAGLAFDNGTHAEAVAVSYPTTNNPDPALLFASARIGSFQTQGIDIDAVHVWEDYILTQDDRDYMWNSGVGRQLL